MMKAIGSFAMALAAVLPAPAMKKAHKPPLAEQGTVLVRVLKNESRRDCPECEGRRERTRRTDGNYTVDGENTTADERYNELKAALDERFAYMFALKADLDRAQSEMSGRWEEYYALHEKYNRELKKIVGLWVTENNYDVIEK